MYILISLFSVAGVALLILFTGTWVYQLRAGNAAILDTVRSASFPMLVMIYFVLVNGYPPRQILMLLTVSCWGIRLARHFHRRHAEDARYTALRERWGKAQNIRMLRFYYFQALMALVLSLPWVLTMLNTTPLNGFELAGSVIWLIAFVGEAIADGQLKAFKSEPSNQNKICQSGLWRYSRHPNYFFEWLISVAYCIISLGSPWGWVSMVCPLAMYFALTRTTGVAFSETRMLQTRGRAFEEYQRTTPAFWPWQKRIT